MIRVSFVVLNKQLLDLLIHWTCIVFCLAPPSITLITGAYLIFGPCGGGPACETEGCCRSEVESHEQSEQSVARARLRALETFWFLLPKYVFSHILGTLFL